MIFMTIESFSQLVAGDAMAGRFTGLGFDTTGYLPVEASHRVRQLEVARFDLDPPVPDDVRRRFDEIRNLHIQGCLDYSHFTEADAAVWLAVEFVLKARLRELHRAEADRINRETLQPLWHRARRDGLLIHRTTAEFLWALDNYLEPIVWAFRERTPFPVDRYDLESARKLRNEAAHPTHNWVLMPVDSARAIGWLAEFINGLWGPPPTVPFEECKRLADTITRVVGTADRGDPKADIQCLRSGLIRARKMRDAGSAWGNEMVQRWEQTGAFYAWRYGKVVVNPQGVPFVLRMWQRRKISSWYEDPADPQIRYGPGTEVELVGPGDNLAERPDGQRVRIRFANGTEIDWPALDLLTDQERTEPKMR
jgi:hypothetical protein